MTWNKWIKSRIAFMYFILVVVLLFGCTTPKVIIRKVEIPYPLPAITDTVTLRDTVIAKDSLWFGNVTDSLGKVIGDLTVYFKKKIASLNLYKDTIYVPVKDTIEVPNNTNALIPAIVGVLSWWEQTILYGGIGLILALLIAIRTKTGKL